MTQEEFIAYLENALGPEQRARVEEELSRDPAALREMSDQLRMDQALRVLLGDKKEQDRVKQSILAVIEAKPLQTLKAEVLDSMQARSTPSFKTKSTRLQEWVARQISKCLPNPTPKFAWASAGLAVTLVFVGLWWFATQRGDWAALADVSHEVTVIRSTASQLARSGYALEPGDHIRIAAKSAATIRFRDHSQIKLGANSSVNLAADTKRSKSLHIEQGRLSAAVAPQPSARPLRIFTPHMVVTVIGTEFDLDVDADETRIQVQKGAVEVALLDASQKVRVESGQMSGANVNQLLAPKPIERNPAYWPFAQESPWNQPIGSDARFVPVRSAYFKGFGPLRGIVEPRPIFMASERDPKRKLFLNARQIMEVQTPDFVVPPNQPDIPISIVHPNKMTVTEFRGVSRLPAGDLSIKFWQQMDLLGSGIESDAKAMSPFGWSSMAGVIRKGELTTGIRHALAMAVNTKALKLPGPDEKPFVWPAVSTIQSFTATGSEDSNLLIGTLLAIPPTVNIAQLGLGQSGPGYEIARGLQDYGVYIVGSTFDPIKIYAWDNDLPPNIDVIFTRLLPFLAVVENNSPTSIGGGGNSRRRPLPPPFANKQ
ncbi:MAG: FecR domain-containing protein [Verrucomicrobiota bacterium]